MVRALQLRHMLPVAVQGTHLSPKCRNWIKARSLPARWGWADSIYSPGRAPTPIQPLLFPVSFFNPNIALEWSLRSAARKQP